MAQTVAQPAPYSFLDEYAFKIFRWDLKAIVGSVLLGVLLTVVNFFLERIDTALTGGAFLIFGGIGFATFAALSTIWFRLPGGVITGEVNAIISLATAASPMSPWFFPTNAIFPIIYTLVLWKFRMDRWWHYVLGSFVSMFGCMLCILLGLLVTLKLPITIAVTSYFVTATSGFVGSAILSIVITRAVNRSRVLG